MVFCLSGCASEDESSKESKAKAPVARRDKLFDVTFAHDQVAFAVGYPGICLRSPNYGESWERISIPTNEALYGVAFADKNHGVIVGRQGILLATSDSGGTWNKITVKKPGSDEPLAESLFAVAFGDNKHGIVVGSFGTILRTEDGGQTWNSQFFEPMKSAAISSIFMFDANRGCLSGEYPSWEADMNEQVDKASLSNVFCTKDGGKTWNLVKTQSPYHLFSIRFVNDHEGWATGSKGTLLHTTDGGQTWSKVNTPTQFHLFDIKTAGNGLIIVGDGGTILSYANGKFTPIAAGLYVWLMREAFADAKHGVAVGGRGAILVTSDGGASWRQRGYVQ